MSYQNHLSDTDITPPLSPQSVINDNSPPNYEDMSHLTSNFNVPRHIDNSHLDSSYYDDIQDSPLYFSYLQVTQPQPTTPLQFFPRVADSSHAFFPQSPLRNSVSIIRRRISTPYNPRHHPHTNYHQSQTRINFPVIDIPFPLFPFPFPLSYFILLVFSSPTILPFGIINFSCF